METNEWLATMRTAWKAGIDRDERDASATSAQRLARAVAPETGRPRRQVLRDLLPLAACIAACVLCGIWLRHTMTAPRVSAAHEIRADEAPAQATSTPAMEPAMEPALAPVIAPAGETPTSSAAPAASLRPSPAPASKPKSDTGALPPLPRPTPPPDEVKLDRRWLRRGHPAPPPMQLPRRAPRGHVREL